MTGGRRARRRRSAYSLFRGTRHRGMGNGGRPVRSFPFVRIAYQYVRPEKPYRYEGEAETATLLMKKDAHLDIVKSGCICIGVQDTGSESSMLIDNSRNTYHPVRLRCGVRAMCRPEVLGSCPSLLEHLNADLVQCLQILPVSVHALVRRTLIWVNLTYCYGRRDRPEHINHTTAHHHEAWLLW